MLDNILLTSGIHINQLESTTRNLNTLNDYLNILSKDDSTKPQISDSK